MIKAWIERSAQARRDRNFERIEAELREMRYRPGSDIKLFGRSGKGPFAVQVRVIVMDRDIHESCLMLHHSIYLKPFWPKHRILRNVYKGLKELEAHEAGEFFKYKDVRLFDPHSPLENRALMKTLKAEARWWQIDWHLTMAGYFFGLLINCLFYWACYFLKIGGPISIPVLYLGPAFGASFVAFLESKWAD